MKIWGVTGWKNSGKTGLVERLVAEFVARGLTVSTIKHAHHGFDIDHEGTDSYRHRAAGTRETLISSGRRWALMHELGEADEPPLEAIIAKLDPADLILIEGYKAGTHPKIECHRGAVSQPTMAPDNPTIRAVASDEPLALDMPVFHLDDTARIADFILADGSGQSGGAAPPAKLRNDCFALPPGVDWIPVDMALDRLRASLAPVVVAESVPLETADGRIAAAVHRALRANPPAANAAVDGYGFAHASLPAGAPITLPMAPGRVAAGEPQRDGLPPGHALRILTGALLPEGVDTVVLDEDITKAGGTISFASAPKKGANTRRAGEDVAAGDTILTGGALIRPPDIALLAATGIATARVRARLRVGVLSTGDEITGPGQGDDPARTYDANRPMLLPLLTRWGHRAVDLGHVPDDRTALRSAFTTGAETCDAILTSGGASAGDEDHVSALLATDGTVGSWRIALKPGRPLVLALWQGKPVFGLPGNPVAALVCTLIFARPALSLLAGGGWSEPLGFTVPAAFSKTKKPGRREYLRARLDANGHAQVFPSEGSGRIFGLSWASGLVELEDGARTIAPGDPVRFIPYSSFGI